MKPKPDIQKIFAAEIRRTQKMLAAEAKALSYAMKGLELANAGKIKEGRAMEAKAKRWIAELERLKCSPP